MSIARLLRTATIAAGAIAAVARPWGRARHRPNCSGTGAAAAWSAAAAARACASARSSRRARSSSASATAGCISSRQPGQAISYPIAVPREESRWAGTTSVTNKRINPSWTPTPEMMPGKSAPAALGAGWASHEPAGRARALSGLQHLPHPWHGCALDHRHGRVEGLHPHVQPGRAGSLSARFGRRQGDGDLERASMGVATSSSGGSSSNGGGSIFNFFGNDDPPPEKPRPRPGARQERLVAIRSRPLGATIRRAAPGAALLRG